MHAVTRTSRKMLVSGLAVLGLSVGALGGTAPTASAALDQCSVGTVCVWSQTNYGGDFSYWSSQNIGCHDHAGIDVRAIYNRSSATVTVPGRGITIPAFQMVSIDQAVTGNICISS